MSIATVATAIARTMGINAPLTFDTAKPDGQFRKPASNAKLVSLLPEFKFTPFDEALKESTEWFVQHYDKGARV